jgi:protein gp37
MGDRTGIEWTDATWNPLRGCSRVSAGCQHCYAETVAARFCGAGQPYEGLIHEKTRGWNGTIKLVPEALQIPYRWARPRRIFVNSMSDLFHPDVPFEFIAAVFFIMSVTTRHTYQVLTKRPERMLEFFEWLARYDGNDDHVDFMFAAAGALGQDKFHDLFWHMTDAVYYAAHTIPEIAALPWEPQESKSRGGYDNCGPGWPYANVWLGVSVENQTAAEERIPLLLQCPAAVRWISAEPLLGPIDLQNIRWTETPIAVNALTPNLKGMFTGRSLPGLNWVVAGGESGTGARPMHPDWVRSLRDQCAAAGVPFLFKQWGSWRPIGDGTPEWSESLYRSRRKARGSQDQAAIDDIYGRVCTTNELVINVDGAAGPVDIPNAFRPGAMLTFDVGKKRAGRLLDGFLHDAYPPVATVTLARMAADG